MCPYSKISQPSLSQSQSDNNRRNPHVNWKILSEIGSGKYCLANQARLYSARVQFSRHYFEILCFGRGTRSFIEMSKIAQDYNEQKFQPYGQSLCVRRYEMYVA